MTEPDIVAGVIALNRGRLVGKTRLQKTIYLLQKCGMEEVFDFDYYNFGPFSAELADAADWAEAEGKIITTQRSGSYAAPYTEYVARVAGPDQIGGVTAKELSEILTKIESCSAITLELAATMVFLKDDGVSEEALDETLAKLKPLKTTAERLSGAHKLVRQLNL